MTWKPYQGQKIERLFAWIATEPDGGEGVCAVNIPGVGWTPLVGADGERIASYRAYAGEVRAATGRPVRLVAFATRVDGEELP